MFKLQRAILLVALLSGCSTAQHDSKRLPAGSEGESREYNDPQAFFKALPLNPSAPKHVHHMHLDGFRPDLFKQLLDSGKLPNFSLLMSRGRASYKASTVDKSETMKVIESYLTSRRDTYIVGWWQFHRDLFQFKNYWLDPVEVVNYAVGLEFPRYPSIYDYLAAKGETVTSGFGLHRRGVAFKNYSRAYIEGATAVFKHTYLDQLHATMDGTLATYERIARGGERLPAFSNTLLAAADEFSHLEGVKRSHADQFINGDEYCFQRGQDPRIERVFKTLEEDDDARGSANVVRHFTRVIRTKRGAPMTVCIQVPRLELHSEPAGGGPTSLGEKRVELAAPRYVLGMLMIDVELGRLIDTLRAIRFDEKGKVFWDPSRRNGVSAYVREGKSEHSLFENTLFMIHGDHGMADTRYMMTPIDAKHPDINRNPKSQDYGLVQYLDRALGLAETAKTSTVAPVAALGIDDAALPLRLAFPHKDSSWQGPEIRKLVVEAEAWAAGFFAEVRDTIKDKLHQKYWWMLFLKGVFIDPRLEAGLKPYQPAVLDTLAQLYLKGEPAYIAAERAANKAFYEKHVQLVYGGGARNNAELFIPSPQGWSTRPSYDEILAFKGPSGTRLVDAIKRSPGVGLIFVRKNNGAIAPGYEPRQGKMEIAVSDRFGNSGVITVERDEETSELIYGYRVDAASSEDPLGYGELGRGEGIRKTYNEWNDLSVTRDHYYHNVVAGMGSFLYSNNPAIGDLTLMRAQGWNFGENAGGHGGVHKEEKLTVMMVSGAGIVRGGLMAKPRFVTAPGGELEEAGEDAETHPTVVDIVPSVLHWLGHGEGALADFARDGFEAQLRKWCAGQREELAKGAETMEDIKKASKLAGFEIPLEKFRPRIERLLKFVGREPPLLPDFSRYREDGNLLKF